MITLNPYLVFKDNCEEAFNFYKIVFGGELYIGRYKDVPLQAKRFFPLSQDEKTMHASLKLTPDITLMGCDSIEAYTEPARFANNFYLYISADNQAEAIRIFNELSVEGEIIMPIDKTFWSTCYGMLTDKFGIRWKVTSAQN